MLDRAGQVLGNYKLLRLLGRGGFSDVYLAEHIHLNTYAAIKVLHAQLAEGNLENFRTEARTLARLKHPNIVQVLDFGVVGMTPYLVMQHALNGTLRQRHPCGVPVALNVVVSYVRSMAAALQYAHNQKLIHRDVKPENMLIGEQNQILLSDFGIAVVDASSHQAGTSFDPVGTVAYMAPEQIQGKAVPASDQYELAIVVYEWLAGVLPFNGSYMAIMSQQVCAPPPSLREKMPSIPADVEQVVLIALSKDPQKRFGHIEAFAQALEQAAQIGQGGVVASHQKKSSEVSTMEAVLMSPLGRTILGATKVTIGRAPDNTLVLADAKVSPYHAEVRPEGPYYTLVDLSNGGGTFVNEQLVSSRAPRLLQPGDMIRIGDTKFRFMMDSGTSTTIPARLPRVPNYPRTTPKFGIQPPVEPQPRPPMVRIVSVVIAVIIIVAGVSGFFVYNNQVTQDHIYATATAQTLAHHRATATVVAQQNAAATAVASTNLTATTVATSPYMPFAKVALDNSLTTASAGWDANSTCQISAAGYRVSIAQNSEVQFCLNSGQYGEMAYQVTMTVHQGDCGGLTFRYVDANNLYFFEVCQDGTYDLGDYVNGKVTLIYSSFQASSVIQRGLDVHNLIAITVQGDTINMYVNKSRIDSATSASLATTFSQGHVGLLAYDVSDPTSVIYTNALVWTT